MRPTPPKPPPDFALALTVQLEGEDALAAAGWLVSFDHVEGESQ